jgi:hypothetical protein
VQYYFLERLGAEGQACWCVCGGLCAQGLKAADAVVVADIPIVFMLAQHPRPVDEPSQPA